MWRVYFYGEVATPETFSLNMLARCVEAIGIPDDLHWFEIADIEWEAVNSDYINRQFTGPGEPPQLKLVHKRQ